VPPSEAVPDGSDISSPDFLSGGGEMGTRIRDFDWSRHPLGTSSQWPQSLKTAVSLILSSRHPMWIGWGPEISFLYNDAYLHVLGNAKHPWALGHPASEVWAEIWDICGPLADKVFREGEASFVDNVRLFMYRGDFLEETFYSFSYSPIRDESGQVAGLFCPSNDITSKALSERRLRTLSQLAANPALESTAAVCSAAVATLAKNTDDCPFALLYLVDSEGSSASLLEPAALSAEHLRLCPEHIQLDDLDASTEAWPIGAVYRSGKPRTISVAGVEGLPLGLAEQRITRAMVLPVVSSGLERPAGILVLGVSPARALDFNYQTFFELVAGQIGTAIQNARAVEDERKRADALAEIDRAKTTFFSNVSHEFRTPLTLMLGPIEDVLGRPEIEIAPAGRELLRVAQRNGLRLQRLVNALLDFSRIEAGRARVSYEQVDLAALTTDLASGFRSAMERAGLQFHVACPPLTHPVFVDREMWEKIVLNLLSNAFKYTLEGSVSVTLRETDGAVELSIRDTGIGIPEHELPHLFKRFHRVEGARGRTHEGSGIGLALVQELVKLHHGNISVASASGSGSTFTVTIPIGHAHLPKESIRTRAVHVTNSIHGDGYVEQALQWLPAEAAPKSSATTPAAFRHVLLAEDNADMRDYVTRLLASRYRVTAVSNGEEALAAALSEPPDLILTDVMMPAMDGFELLKALRSRHETRMIPVVMLSARSGEESRVEGFEAGADDYLVKPFSGRELLARVGVHIALRLERHRTQERLARIFSQAPVGIAVFRGPDFVAELANPFYESLLEGRVVLGRKLRDIAPELSPRVWDVLNQVLATGQPFIANEFHVPYDFDRDGRIEDHWFNVAYQPLVESDGKVSGLVAVVAEVTAQVKARLSLERANQELEEFAFVASHDLQEPLRMVTIFTELLLKSSGLSDDSKAREYADFVHTGVRRMDTLIKDLLIYGKVVHPNQENPPGSADLNRSVEEAISVMCGRIAESNAVVTHGPLPVVSGNEKQFALVLQNLISNSLKYRKPDVAPEIHIDATPHGSDWLVRIQDNGIGFQPQYAQRIFGLFKRLHNDAYPGTGLGLAICKRVVERHGGKIWAESEGDGKGASIFLLLQGQPEGGITQSISNTSSPPMP
jgi:signal transduction histidine kinase